MAEQHLRYLAVLVCLYSFFEFLLKRILWKQPEKQTRKVAAKEATVLLFTLLVGTSGFLSVTLAIGFVLIAIVHILLAVIEKKRSMAIFALEIYLLKQAVLGVLLYVLWRIAVPIAVHGWYATCERAVLSGLGESADVLRDRFALVLSIVASYFFMIDGGTRIVKGILGKFPVLYQKVLTAFNDSKESEENVGEWIGILERIIALTFVLIGNFTAIAFVLTAKSIARFKALEESKDFAEYYLLGTLGSMIVAIGTGMFTRIIFGL